MLIIFFHLFDASARMCLYMRLALEYSNYCMYICIMCPRMRWIYIYISIFIDHCQKWWVVFAMVHFFLFHSLWIYLHAHGPTKIDSKKFHSLLSSVFFFFFIIIIDPWDDVFGMACSFCMATFAKQQNLCCLDKFSRNSVAVLFSGFYGYFIIFETFFVNEVILAIQV